MRLLTAAVLLPAFVGALLFLPPVWWSLVLACVAFIAGLEWAALTGMTRRQAWMFAGLTAGSAVVLSLLELQGHPVWLQSAMLWAAAGFWLIVVPAWLAARWRSAGLAMAVAAGWLTLVPTHFALFILQRDATVLLMLLGTVWIADSAAYFAGRAMGRRRLAPAISPGKTWEGVAGAAAAVAVYYAVLYVLFAPAQPLLAGAHGPILFAIVAVLSVEGDLFESWIKRQAGAKDSGALLPGHGGVLDRIDGLTASMPVAALWCHVFSALSRY